MHPIVVFAPDPEAAKKGNYRVRPDKWVARVDNPGVEGTGNTPAEAVHNCKQALHKYVDEMAAVQYKTSNGCFERYIEAEELKYEPPSGNPS